MTTLAVLRLLLALHRLCRQNHDEIMTLFSVYGPGRSSEQLSGSNGLKSRRAENAVNSPG
jgi:hypothetical protein